MRSLVAVAAIAIACASAAEGRDGAEAILDLLNSKFSGGTTLYSEAATKVAIEARKGLPLQQFVTAIISVDDQAPAMARLSKAERAAYMESSKPKITALAEEKNNPLAWYLLFLESGDTNMLVKAADLGNVQALNALGTMRLLDVLAEPGVPSSDDVRLRKSYAMFERAATTHDANALNNVGNCLLNGYGCEKDEAKAMSKFEEAAKSGHPEAMNNLARFYREGIVVRKDLRKALECFRKSAVSGNIWGKLNYALAVLKGEGTDRDVGRAVELLELIAKAGNAEAMDILADVFERGAPGFEPDPEMSVVWTIRARAARGDANSEKWLRENGRSIER